MNYPKRGETTSRLLASILKPQSYEREPITKPAPPPLNCPKCGKQLGRGKYMHLKNCKG
jgi:hypothetical protein